jgi:hypothetical protein
LVLWNPPGATLKHGGQGPVQRRPLPLPDPASSRSTLDLRRAAKQKRMSSGELMGGADLAGKPEALE